MSTGWVVSWASKVHIVNDLVQDCSNSSALAMELLQSRTEPSIPTYCMTGQHTLHTIVHFLIYCWHVQRIKENGKQLDRQCIVKFVLNVDKVLLKRR